MTCITLQEQPEYEFHYEIQIQIGHLYYSGRVGHDALVRIAHEARVQLFQLLGVNENDFGDNRTGIIIGDLVVSGVGDLLLFDNVQVDSHVGNMGRAGFRLFHRFRKGDVLIALLETGLMTFDYRARSVVPVPALFRNALRQYVEQRGRAGNSGSVFATSDLDTISFDDDIFQGAKSNFNPVEEVLLWQQKRTFHQNRHRAHSSISDESGSIHSARFNGR